jgi:hypothetical protein
MINDYDLYDQGNHFRNRTVRFTVSWNVMPVGGLLFWETRESKSWTIMFPSDYKTPSLKAI